MSAVQSQEQGIIFAILACMFDGKPCLVYMILTVKPLNQSLISLVKVQVQACSTLRLNVTIRR